MANWPAYPGGPNDLRQGDMDAAVRGLKWIVFALNHGAHFLYSNWLNYPLGFNLAKNATPPLLGLSTYRITEFANPIATLTLLL